jgi:WD40 repeat protein
MWGKPMANDDKQEWFFQSQDQEDQRDMFASELPSIVTYFGLMKNTEQIDDSDEDIARHLRHPEWSIRIAAIRKLKGRQDNGSLGLLLNALKDDHQAVRAAAVRTLGSSVTTVPLEPLIDMLHDSSWHVRATVIVALAKQAQPAPLELFLEALRDEDESVRANAVWAIGLLKEHAPVDALLAALQDKSWMVREAAAQALGELDTRVPVAALLTASQDRDKNVRAAAVNALWKIYPDVAVRIFHNIVALNIEKSQKTDRQNDIISHRFDPTGAQLRDDDGSFFQEEATCIDDKTVKGPQTAKSNRAHSRACQSTNKKQPGVLQKRVFPLIERGIAVVILLVILFGWVFLHHQVHSTVTGDATIRTIFSYQGNTDSSCKIAWIPESAHFVQDSSKNMIAFTDIYGKVQVWDTSAQRLIASYGPFDRILSLNWENSDLYIVSLAQNGKIFLIRVFDNQTIATFPSQGSISKVAWSHDRNKIAIASLDGSGVSLIRIWDIKRRMYVSSHHQQGAITAVVWSTDDMFIAIASDQKRIELWNALTNQSLFSSGNAVPYISTTYNVVSMAWSQQNLAYVLMDGTVYIYNIVVGTDTPLTATGGWTKPSFINQSAMDWSPDGKRLAVAVSDGKIQIWDYLGNLLYTYNGHSQQVNNIVWSFDGSHVISSSVNGIVLEWTVPK